MRRFSALPVKAPTPKGYIRVNFMEREAAAEETAPAVGAATRRYKYKKGCYAGEPICITAVLHVLNYSIASNMLL